MKEINPEKFGIGSLIFLLIILFPFFVLAQGSDGTTMDPALLPADTSANPPKPNPASAATPATSPKPTPKITPKSLTPVPIATGPAAPEDTVPIPSLTIPSAGNSKNIIIGAILAAGAALLAFFGLNMRKKKEDQQDDKKCLNFKKLMEEKMEELTDLKGQLANLAKEKGKGVVKIAISGTKAGDVLIFIEKRQKEYDKLKELYEKCIAGIPKGKTKFILHGGYTRTDNEMNRSFFEEITRDVPDGGTILLCYFASQEEDVQKKFQEDSISIKKQTHSKNLKFLLATEENFMDQVKKASAIYIRGGSTPKLLETLNKYPDFKNNLKNKTVAGSSAGAYAIGNHSPFHSDETGEEVRQGLGLLPLPIACHYESESLAPNKRSLTRLKSLDPKLEPILLKDFEWKIINK
ncbi:MAG TPA: Type 1 glutamine amidotransferase-like domain-containing protein [Candidatus Paceibacterota bacterium]|jgi:peptidase E|nr:Type 1 glutamine amidotransferase-like domain-containing protein [Candidatus Paceibacterota bacterium]